MSFQYVAASSGLVAALVYQISGFFAAVLVLIAGWLAGAAMVSFAGSEDATAQDGQEVAKRKWDYIIVGGGTAGCVLANRLSKGGEKSVLVLEAGPGEHKALSFRIPAGVLKLFQSKYDWSFFTENEKAAANRGIYICRGKVLGGSSCLNVCLYNRGDAHDYDLWENEFGCVGWKASDVLPHFLRTQDDHTGLAKRSPKYHSSGGEWGVDHVRYQNPLSARFLEACKQKGLPQNDDFCDWDKPQLGCGRFTVSETNGQRTSAALNLLDTALADGERKLKVLTGAYTRKVCFTGSAEKGDLKAEGVQFSAGGAVHTVKVAAAGEVILAGGAFHSPHLLMLSGIGPAEHLKQHGIPVVKDLAGVGANMQDHPACAVSYQCPESKRGVSVTSEVKLGSLPHPRPLLQWLFTRSGPLTSTGCDHGAFLKTPAVSEDAPSADLQMRFLAARAVTADGMASYLKFKKSSSHPDGFSFQSIAVRPHSRGRVLLKSADPGDKPVVEGGFLSDSRDVDTIREGIKLSRELAKQPAFAEFLGHEFCPGPEVQTDEQINKYIAETVHTANAVVGTCRMGQESDPLTVCDPEMRLKGCKALRICDASVMPKLPGGQAGACVVMMAERACDFIQGEGK